MNAPEQELAIDAVYYALFRVVEVGELEDAEAAVAWAQSALEGPELREGLVARVAELPAARRVPAGHSH